MRTTDDPRQLLEDIRFLASLRFKEYEVGELLRIIGGDDTGYDALISVWSTRAGFKSAEGMREQLLQLFQEGGFVYRYQDRILSEDSLNLQLVRVADLLWSLKKRSNGDGVQK